MAIALTCPSCERALKVKDELAGRKIKCPKCGTVIAVMSKAADSEARITAKKPARVQQDEEPEEEERPKKKKKKKSKSNSALLIGVAIGGVALIGVIVLFLMMSGGNAKEKVVAKRPEPAPINTQPAVNAQPEENPAPIEKKAPAGTAARVREGTVVRNTLRQLGIAYKQFEVENNRGPKNQKELGPYYQNVAEINEYLTKNWITFIWGASRQSLAENGDSNTVLAYEPDPDRQGIRLVLFGDGSVRDLDENEFSKAPKAKGK
jgi:predicted Zn finger-like uncharacterized protein